MSLVLVGALGLAPAITAEPTAAQEGPMTITSFDGTGIDIMVCKPAGADANAPAPVILQSHGWGGSRSNCGSFTAWLDAGFGVVSISQRGFGASGGQAHVHDPEFEGQDNIAVIDRIATFDWVMMDSPGDPVLGAIGGSYGGAYQFITALTEIRDLGDTRLDALAPEITWYDLVESLAPNAVLRTGWVTALYGAGAANVHQGIHEAYWYAMATGQLPDGSVPGVYNVVDDFAGNSPRAFVEAGIQLDIPVLIGQGLTDNLFNLNQGWKNFENTLTDGARAQSIFIGYNGGHVLPNVLPLGSTASGDPCSAPYGGFSALSRAFFENHLMGKTNVLPSMPYNVATNGGRCVSVASLDTLTDVSVGIVASPVLAGAPVHYALATGPMTVAGIGKVSGIMTSTGVDARLFFALSKGTTPATAQVLSNNMMPLRSALPALFEAFEIELPGAATDLAAGETLYLTVSPVSDMSFAHGSRTPGAMVLSDVTVGLPVV